MRAICKTTSGETIALTGSAVKILREHITQGSENKISPAIPLGWITIGNTAVNFANVETVFFEEGERDERV